MNSMSNSGQSDTGLRSARWQPLAVGFLFVGGLALWVLSLATRWARPDDPNIRLSVWRIEGEEVWYAYVAIAAFIFLGVSMIWLQRMRGWVYLVAAASGSIVVAVFGIVVAVWERQVFVPQTGGRLTGMTTAIVTYQLDDGYTVACVAAVLVLASAILFVIARSKGSLSDSDGAEIRRMDVEITHLKKLKILKALRAELGEED
jgi:hypothetical protein